MFFLRSELQRARQLSRSRVSNRRLSGRRRDRHCPSRVDVVILPPSNLPGNHNILRFPQFSPILRKIEGVR